MQQSEKRTPKDPDKQQLSAWQGSDAVSADASRKPANEKPPCKELPLLQEERTIARIADRPSSVTFSSLSQLHPSSARSI